MKDTFKCGKACVFQFGCLYKSDWKDRKAVTEASAVVLQRPSPRIREIVSVSKYC